jgi:hypothetical protein
MHTALASESGAPPTAFARRLWGWLLIGAALRCALLPFAFHPDLLSVYDRVRLVRDGSIELADCGFQALPILLHLLWAKLLALPLPDLSGVPWPEPSEAEIFEQGWKMMTAPGALVSLALWKLPYALADLACGWLLARIVGARHALTALALWMLHPIALFTTAVFAKYEAFMLVPLLGGLLLLVRGRTAAGFLALGVAAALRIYPLLLIPPLVLLCAPGARRRLELGAIALAPLVWVLASVATRSLAVGLLLPPVLVGLALLDQRLRGTRTHRALLAALALGTVLAAPWLHRALFASDNSFANVFHHLSFLASPSDASAAGQSVLSLFGLSYGLLLLWCQRRSSAQGAPEHARVDPEQLLDATLLAALCFYGSSFFHPQYAALLCCLAILRLPRLAEGGIAHALQISGVLFSLLAFRGGNASVRLFTPLAPLDVHHLPEPLDVMPAGLDALPWPALGRTLIAVGSVWMALGLLGWLPNPRLATSRGGLAALACAAALWLLAPCAYVASVALHPREHLVPVGQPQWDEGAWSGPFAERGFRYEAHAGPIDALRVWPEAPPQSIGNAERTAPAAQAILRARIYERDADALAAEREQAEFELAPVQLLPPPEAQLPNGAFDLPMPAQALRHGARYRVVLERGAPAPAAERAVRVQGLKRFSGSALLGRVRDEFAARWSRGFEWPRTKVLRGGHTAGVLGPARALRNAWCVLVLGALFAGVALLCTGRRAHAL